MSVAHPDKQSLVAFGQGLLNSDESMMVEQHLQSCSICCETLLDLKDDTFVGLLRAAKPRLADTASDAEAASTKETEPQSRNSSDSFAPTIVEYQQHTIQSDSAETIECPRELEEHPRYRIIGAIGQGGMGAVYRAEHRLMQRPVAIKVIHPDLVRHPLAVERFRREVQAAAKLSHPNIVAAFDAEQAGELHLLVMEYVNGTDLATTVANNGPLHVQVACNYIMQAAYGLQHAHEKGMVHRDIKPHNLMLTSDGRVRILDFGLAGIASGENTPEVVPSRDGPAAAGLSTHLTSIGSVMGTPDYMAPEQAVDAHSADIRADIYSLGCTLHFLLTGRPPFEGDGVASKLKAHAQTEPASLSLLRKDVPAELSKVVLRMLAKKPSDRFQTPDEVAAALEPFASPLGEGRSRIGRWVAIAAAGFLLLLTGIIVVVTDRGRLEIQSEVDDVKVLVKQGGEQVDFFDLKTGSQIKWIPGGEYELEVVGNSNNVILDRTGFTVSRFGQVVVTAKWSSAGCDVIQAFSTEDRPITQAGVMVNDGGWKITATEPRVVPLFDIPNPNLDTGPYFLRAKLRTENVTGRAYLEMSSLPHGEREPVSKGPLKAISGTTDWAEYELPFFLKKGEQIDRLGLSVTIEGTGSVWIRDVELLGRKTVESAPLQTAVSKTTQANSYTRDQEAAEWILRIGGTLRITVDGVERSVSRREELPDGSWQITEISVYPVKLDSTTRLDRLAGLNSLRWLRLFNTDVSDDALTDLERMPRLQFLDLDHNSISTDAALAHIGRNLTSLETLCLSGTAITDEGLKSLSSLKELKVLNLSGTKLNGSGLSGLADIGSLVELNLSNTTMSDDSLRYLAALPRLTRLSLQKSPFTDSAIPHLAVLKSLRYLEVTETQFSPRGLNALRQQLPELSIEGFTFGEWQDLIDSHAWSPVRPEQFTATNNAVLRRLDDGSLLAGGVNPRQSTYRIVGRTDAKSVSAIRLSTLKDASLPGGGPGRFTNGNFLLTGLIVQCSRKNQADVELVPIRRIVVDFAQPAHDPSQLARGLGEWAIWRPDGSVQEQSLIAEFENDLDPEGLSELIVTLCFESKENPYHTLGRFLLAAGSALPTESTPSGRVSDPQVGIPSIPIGTNLVTDPSFEETAIGRLYPTGWGTGNISPSDSFRHQVSEDAHTGQRGWRIEGDGQFAVVPSNRPAANVAYRYAASAWVKVESGAAQIKLLYFDASGRYIGENQGNLSVRQGDWHKLTIVDELARYPDARSLSLALTMPGPGKAVFDDLEMLAFDSAKLPEKFEATYGAAAHFADVFDHWAGRWEATSMYAPTASTPDEKVFKGEVVVRRILDDRFLLWQWISDKGDSQSLALLCFDDNIKAYHIWIFSSAGEVFERIGSWDAASQTLSMQVKPPAPGVSGASTDRFVDPDRIESTLLVRNQAGQVTRDVRSKWIRRSKEAEAELVLADAPAADVTELAVLQKLIGRWSIQQTLKPSVWVPEGNTSAGTEENAWVLDGRFVLSRAWDDQQNLTSLALQTYDPAQKVFRHWHFAKGSFGGQWRISWDASSRAFHWQSTDMPVGWIGTGFNRWINDDTFDNQSLIKDEGGRVLMDLMQKKQRQK